MPRPVILTVDDDPAVLSAIDRDLRRHYGRDYRIIKAASGRLALEVLGQLAERSEPVALLLVDQRMPELSGVEVLEQARQHHPEARKVLLTAYADTDAAIQAINRVGLDYYLMKPWDPPEEILYPILDDLLDAWRREAPLPYDGIRLAGALWSPESHTVKDFLARHQIPYQWLDIDRDPQARALVAGEDGPQIPTVLFPDGSLLRSPSLSSLADKLGLQRQAARTYYDLTVIGAGPAGLAAAVYASSEGLRCVVIERQAPGGQAGRSPKIENYLGFPAGISGGDLARRAVTQAQRFGTEILSAQEAQRVRAEDRYRVVVLSDGSEIVSGAVLLACGATFRTLKMPGAAELTGKGIFYGAAHTEATYYRDQDVFVIGGANSAAQGALFLSRYARKVTVLVRGAHPVAAGYLVEAMRRSECIEILENTDLVAAHGTDHLEALDVRDSVTHQERRLEGSALFVFIGVRPESDIVADVVLRDEKGYILTGLDLLRDGHRPEGWPLNRDPMLLETSLPGVFAAGDVRFGTSHRVASATGEGAAAVAIIRQYLAGL
ncbi:MAG TPA: FAD-dependent oxidoreductase [Anaerolineales bacterium]|nr:FAD-dependent oxidoreductase [Anaerolineales bacterium]